jgi:geranylgeranyl pyrophosphate synthase
MNARAFEAQLTAYRELVSAHIREAIPKREPQKHLYEILSAQLSNQGKGIRPALCLATSRAFGGAEERALPSAAAIELLHNAFLVHDDIEDGSVYRRGLPTLHVQHGVPLALNAGDAMNSLSVRLLRANLTTLGPELAARVFDEFDHMSIETIEGQAMELGWIRDNDCATSEDDYLLMVLKKTAWYSFIHPARIGAMIAEPERVDLDRFDRFGYFLGTAFQIQDDVLNLIGDRQKYGKEIGGDLLEGKRTLILSHLLAHGDAHEKARIKAFLAKPRAQRLPRELSWLLSLMQSRGSIEYARNVAQQFAQSAKREFAQAYAGATPGAALDFVTTLVEYMVTREA